MKRIVCLIALLAFSAPASARDSYFTFHGHRIHISALRHCRSLSCIRASIPDLGYGRHNRDRDADVDTTPDQVSPSAPAAAPAPPPAPAPVAAPAPPPQPAPAPAPSQAPAQASPAPAPAPVPVQTRPASPPIQAQPAPVQSPALAPVIAQIPTVATRTPVAAAPGAAGPALAAATTEQLVRPSVAQPSARQETTASTPNATPSVGFEVPKPQSAEPSARIAPVANTPAAVQPQPKASPPQVASASDDSDDDAVDTPLGDWQTDGKNGLVRIETCGAWLCGYVLDATTLAKGETILVNMKPKSDISWSGNIFSRSSGNVYFGIITMKEPNTLRVEACALGKFICSGNDWTRIGRGRSLREDKRETSQASPSRS